MSRNRHILIAVALVATAACDDDSTTPGATNRMPPDPVDDLSLAVAATDGTVDFSWTAPRDDLFHDSVDHYLIRVAYAEPFTWEHAAPGPPGPAPELAGSAQSATFDAVRGRDLYAAVRSYDSDGNESPLSNVAYVRVPGVSFQVTCLEAVTRAPVPGLGVQVTSSRSASLATDASGRAGLGDLSEGTLGVRIDRGVAAIPYHRLADALVIDGDRAVTYPMIKFTAPSSTAYASVLEIVLDGMVSQGGTRIVKNWASYPIAWYADSFVNVHGVDYRATAERAAARWNERVGLPIFAVAPASPAVGVALEFLPRAQMGVQNGITIHSNDAGGYPRFDRVRIVDDFQSEQQLYLIMLHEFGHTIRLSHLPGGFIMFGGQPLPPDISDDEVETVRVLVSLPNALDLSIYDPAPPQ